MLIREGEMAESNNKPVCRQLLTYVSPESDSSSEEEETPQFHEGILKQIEKMEQMLKKCEEREQVGEKKNSKQISGNGEEDEFDYEKWVKEQCKKIKEIEEGEFHEKTMEAMVEESDLSLVSLARPAIELKRFKCKFPDAEDIDQENLDMKLSEYALKNLRKCPWLEFPDWLNE